MEWTNILAIIGGVSIVVTIGLTGVFLYTFIMDKIEDLKWVYKRKHRFDKPPTAACYCKDCKYYATVNDFGKCRRGHITDRWNIADSWFCWQAEPLEVDPELVKDNRKDNIND